MYNLAIILQGQSPVHQELTMIKGKKNANYIDESIMEVSMLVVRLHSAPFT